MFSLSIKSLLFKTILKPWERPCFCSRNAFWDDDVYWLWAGAFVQLTCCCRRGTTMPHCVAFGCNFQSKRNKGTDVSLHSFPHEKTRRKQWEDACGRVQLPKDPRLCSSHFSPDAFEAFNRPRLIKELTGASGYKRRLKSNAVPTIFRYEETTGPGKASKNRAKKLIRPEMLNRFRDGCKQQPASTVANMFVDDDDQSDTVSVMEETSNEAAEATKHSVTRDHDYCSVPEPSAEDLSKDVESLRKEIQALRVQREFGLQRFAGSDTDIQFYTRFPSYDHLMAFWVLIEPCIYETIRASRAKSAANTDEEVLTPARAQTRQLLQPIDEFFLFLVFLSVGLKERDLAHRFNIHQSTVSSIIATWTSFLATALGSQCIWLTRAEVQTYLPKEFKGFSDTQVILDCAELRCQTPSSPLLQSETYSSYKSHCTMKALVGIAPHGPVTFISDLYAGSVSDKELFKQSGIAEKLTEDMAVMVDKGFLITDCCKCKVYHPPFVSKQKKKKNQVKEMQATVRLRLHVERVIRRIKQNKLFDGIITMSPVYNINQLFAVACMLSNYQNTALVKKRVK
ncbi:uncharacterized protein LOC120722458 isoform X2 [Simochromis diagramma]|uniref:uncharacterized protein LOC120722458 isoform X2 n=1 Tax=Simochromis diagramma TaxID=43689 RepID=UPI001A7F0F0C|nr:uncharacterized protein LOC120722458 isoform X2 [Simochromis diagramma]